MTTAMVAGDNRTGGIDDRPGVWDVPQRRA